jgi:O-antigen/teichoic acid export membrane protein
VSVTRRNVAANLFGGVWTALLSLLFIPLYLRILGAEAFGLVGLLGALQAVFGVLDLGLGATFNREMARLSAGASDGTRERDLLRTLEAVYWSAGALVIVLVAALAGTIAHRWVHAQHLPADAIRTSILLMGSIVAFQFPFSLYQAGLLGRQRQVLLNVITISVTTVRSVGAVLLIWRVSPSIELFFAWQALLMLVQTAITAMVLRRDLPHAPRRARVDFSLIRDLWKFSAAIAGSAILGVALTQTDKMLLSGMLSLSQFGYYTLAGSVAAVMWYVITPIATAFYPRFTQVLHAGDERRTIETYHRACQFMAMALLPLAATVCAFSHELIVVWTHNAALADAAALTAALLVCGTALNGLANLPILLGVAAGYPQIVTITNLIGVVIIVPAVIFATRTFGTVGAASVWVVLNALYIAVSVPLLHRRVLPDQKRRWYVDDFLKPVLVAGCAVAVARLLLPAGLGAPAALAWVAAAGLLAAFATALVLPEVRSFAWGFVVRRRESVYGH